MAVEQRRETMTDLRNNGRSGVPVLELQDVTFSYRSARGVVDAVAATSLSIHHGELVCIVGPSGCGKTTMLRLMAGFLSPATGAILDQGQPVSRPDWRRGMVFQKPQLYPWLSVLGNVEFGPRMRGIARARRREVAEYYVRMVKLWEFRNARPYELSGGMQQRTALARVLANEPHTLLMDEPFAALDALTREHMQDELLAIWKRTHGAVALVTHSVEEAVYLATRVLVVSQRPARIIADIPIPFSSASEERDPREVKSDPEFVALREHVLRYVWT